MLIAHVFNLQVELAAQASRQDLEHLRSTRASHIRTTLIATSWRQGLLFVCRASNSTPPLYTKHQPGSKISGCISCILIVTIDELGGLRGKSSSERVHLHFETGLHDRHGEFTIPLVEIVSVVSKSSCAFGAASAKRPMSLTENITTTKIAEVFGPKLESLIFYGWTTHACARSTSVCMK